MLLTDTLALWTLSSPFREINNKESSGLTPIELGITLAVFVGLFLFLVCVGELLKIFNKPTTEAAPYVSVNRQLYQPSAAGYGSKGQKQVQPQQPVGGLIVPNNKKGGDRTSLLESASPMGTGGRGIDDSFGDSGMTTPSSHGHGGGSGGDYFSRGGDYGTSGPSKGHARGQSSGISMPGPAATRRGGGGGGGDQHPRLNGASPVGPDGGGFRPGQIFNYASMAPGAVVGPPPINNGGYRGPGANPQLRQQPIGRGPPPAQDGNRRSRYTRSRIDSVGPGVLRKSMYMNGDDDGRSVSGDAYASAGAGASSSNLRRVESINKGDPRRKSQYGGGGAGANSNPMPTRGGRQPSIYNNAPSERATLLSAQADNFGAGRSDPLSARRGPSPGPGYSQGPGANAGGYPNMSRLATGPGSGPGPNSSNPYPPPGAGYAARGSPSPSGYSSRGPPPPHMQAGYPGPRNGPPQGYGRPQMTAGGGGGQRQIL